METSSVIRFKILVSEQLLLSNAQVAINTRHAFRNVVDVVLADVISTYTFCDMCTRTYATKR